MVRGKGQTGNRQWRYGSYGSYDMQHAAGSKRATVAAMQPRGVLPFTYRGTPTRFLFHPDTCSHGFVCACVVIRVQFGFITISITLRFKLAAATDMFIIVSWKF